MKIVVATNEYRTPDISRETIDAMEELGTVLKTIYLRMRKEGYAIINGRMVKIEENE